VFPKFPYLAVPLFFGICIAAFVGPIIYKINLDADLEFQDRLSSFDKTRAIAAFGKSLKAGAVPEKNMKNSDQFFKGETPAIVTAKLLTNLKNFASARGIEILRAADLPDQKEKSFYIIGASLDLSGNQANILGLIQDIETAKPKLFIDKMSVRASGQPLGSNVEVVLTVSLEVSGAIDSQDLPNGI
jgi:Type II secretion system (T2SS), protein M subtype b